MPYLGAKAIITPLGLGQQRLISQNGISIASPLDEACIGRLHGSCILPSLRLVYHSLTQKGVGAIRTSPIIPFPIVASLQENTHVGPASPIATQRPLGDIPRDDCDQRGREVNVGIPGDPVSYHSELFQQLYCHLSKRLGMAGY